MGIFAPTAWNLAGSARNSLISSSSSIASSQPATSRKVVFGVSLLATLALDLPNCITRLPPPCTELSRKKKRTPMMMNGIRVPSRVWKKPGVGFLPTQDSRLPAATRALSRSISCSLWLPTQTALYLAGLSPAMVTWISCSPSTRTTSLMGSLPLMMETTLEVGSSEKPPVRLPVRSTSRPMAITARTIHRMGPRKMRLAFMTYLVGRVVATRVPGKAIVRTETALVVARWWESRTSFGSTQTSRNRDAHSDADCAKPAASSRRSALTSGISNARAAAAQQAS